MRQVLRKVQKPKGVHLRAATEFSEGQGQASLVTLWKTYEISHKRGRFELYPTDRQPCPSCGASSNGCPKGLKHTDELAKLIELSFSLNLLT